MVKTKQKTVEVIKLKVVVIQRDIEDGQCGLVARCMEKVSIERALRKIDPNGGDHKVRVDGGVMKFNLSGYRWQAVTPKMAKVNLIQFDKERLPRAKAEKAGTKFVSKVKPHSYTVEATRGTKIQPFTRDRMEQVYEARRRRAAEGRPDKQKYDLRYRVQGLGSV